MVAYSPDFNAWNARRKELRLSYRALAQRAGISEPTVKRVLNGHAGSASFDNVVAILGALGLRLSILPQQSTLEMRRDEARRKGLLLARLVQGTSGLEAQAVDQQTLVLIAARAEENLLAGPARRLWE